MIALVGLPWILEVAAGLVVVTVIARSGFLLLPQSVELPPVVERALRYAPACALAATIAPSILDRDQHLFLSWHNDQLWAAVAGGLVYARTRSMVALMLTGMAVFTVLRLVSG